MKQISALERLRQLPALFRGSDLTVLFQWSAKTASQYLYLWKKQELIEGLGGHSDVYANLVADSSPNWEAAALLAMPSAVEVGVACLHRAGWTTQIPSRPEIAVDAGQRVFTAERFDVKPRDEKWFESFGPGIVRRQYRVSLPYLKPAWALADLLRTQGWGACGLQPDDIEWHAVTLKDEQAWLRACKALKLGQDELRSFARSSRSNTAAALSTSRGA